MAPGKARKKAAKKKAAAGKAAASTNPVKARIAARSREDELLELLRYLVPSVRRFSVASPDPSKNMLLLDLEDVCYITTKSDDERYSVMFVTEDGGRFYSAKALSQIAKALEEGNPRFLQTGSYYVINTEKVTAWKYAAARTLWFKGSDEPVENAVTDFYLDVFKERFPH